MQRRKNKKKNEREKLFQVKRKKCVQKEFDRADIVRDVRYNVLPMSQVAQKTLRGFPRNTAVRKGLLLRSICVLLPETSLLPPSRAVAGEEGLPTHRRHRVSGTDNRNPGQANESKLVVSRQDLR